MLMSQDFIGPLPYMGRYQKKCIRCKIKNWHRNLDSEGHCPYCIEYLRILKLYKQIDDASFEESLRKLGKSSAEIKEIKRKEIKTQSKYEKIQKMFERLSPEEQERIRRKFIKDKEN